MAEKDHYCETPEGVVLIADGVRKMRRWDGSSDNTKLVGVAAPETACTIQADTTVPDPRPDPPTTACTMQVDNTAPAPPIPAAPTSAGTLVSVLNFEDLSEELRYYLSFEPRTAEEDDVPQKRPYPFFSTVFIVGTYNYRVRFVDKFGRFSPWSPFSNTLTFTYTPHGGNVSFAMIDVLPKGEAIDYLKSRFSPLARQLKYTNLPTTSDPNVVRRQIAIQYPGQTNFYFRFPPLQRRNTWAVEQRYTVSILPLYSQNTGFTRYFIDIDTDDLVTAEMFSNVHVLAFMPRGDAYSRLREYISKIGHRNDIDSKALKSIEVLNWNTPDPDGIEVDGFACVRFLDELGRPSNLSPVSNRLIVKPKDAKYGIEYVNVPTTSDPKVKRRQILRSIGPMKSVLYIDIDTDDLTSTTLKSDKGNAELRKQPSYLLSDEPPKTSGMSGAYSAYVRFINDRGVPSPLSPISNILTIKRDEYVYAIKYTNVPVPTQSNVVRRQILRSTGGQSKTFYVDIDTTNLTATTFVSEKLDFELIGQTAVPLLDTRGEIFADAFGQPPSYLTCMANHLGRTFLAVAKVYSQGNASVTQGSTLVRGINTEWTADMAGRIFEVVGGNQVEIESVNVQNQEITLTDPWTGPTNEIAAYKIRPPSGERKNVYYTKSGEPDAWPSVYAINVREDGDEITGLMVKDSFLYILENRHIYRFTFQTDPGTDGFIFLGINRGCINNNCWVQVDDRVLMMDESGIYFFDGTQAKDVSSAIRNLFSPKGYSGTLAVQWQFKDNFHAVHYPEQRIVKWFVSLTGTRFPQHAICYDYDVATWWIESYGRPISASLVANINSRRRVVLASDRDQSFLADEGSLDEIGLSANESRGKTTSWGPQHVSDPAKSWTSSLVGHSICVALGRGQGQQRRIVGVSGNKLILDRPWAVLPDGESVYQIGGILYAFRTGWLSWIPDENYRSRHFGLNFEPQTYESAVILQVYRDFSRVPVLWADQKTRGEDEGFLSSVNSPDLVCDLTHFSGYAQQRMDGRKELNIEGNRFVSFRLTGVAGYGYLLVRQIMLTGLQQPQMPNPQRGT